MSLNPRITRRVRLGKKTQALLPLVVYQAIERWCKRSSKTVFTLSVEDAPQALHTAEGCTYLVARKNARGLYELSNEVKMGMEMSYSGHHATQNNNQIGATLALTVGDWVITLDRSYGPFTVSAMLVSHPAATTNGDDDTLILTNGWGLEPKRVQALLAAGSQG